MVRFYTDDGFRTEFIVPKFFISLVILFGMSVSCVKDKEYPRYLNEFICSNNLFLRLASN
jgi:hypothetical protein